MSKLWPEVAGQIGDKLEGAAVEAVAVERAQNAVYLTLRAQAPFTSSECAQLGMLLRGRFEGFSVSVRNALTYEDLDEAGVLALAEELKREGLPINGFLEGCSVAIEGGTVTVDVRQGDTLLTQMGFAEKLALRILKSHGEEAYIMGEILHSDTAVELC